MKIDVPFKLVERLLMILQDAMQFKRKKNCVVMTMECYDSAGIPWGEFGP